MKRSIFISAFFLFLLAQCARAQLTWTPIPFDKEIGSFALGSDGSIYVGINLDSDSSSVFRTTDSGANWTQILHIPFISSISCDSNGAVVVVANDSAKLSLDGGIAWQPFGGSDILQCQATRNEFYVTNYIDLSFTDDYGVNWNTVASDLMIEDWARIYCGPENEVIATQSFCSCWISFGLLADTIPRISCPSVDNSPPGFFFDKDGFIYTGLCGLARRAPERGLWDIYDTLYNDTGYIGNGIVHFPLASPQIHSVIDLDSSGTYASTNHGDSWYLIGTGIRSEYSPYVAFDRNVTGYALANNTLYTTANLHSSVASLIPSAPIFIYPIPCSTFLNINSDNVEQIKIFDLLGTLRINQEYQNRPSDPELDVSGLPAGVYSMEVTAHDATSFVRMLKE